MRRPFNVIGVFVRLLSATGGRRLASRPDPGGHRAPPGPAGQEPARAA
jgi:hypothetical protein